MASITKQANGRVTIQFKAPDRKRKSLRLGRTDDKTGQEIKMHVEHLADCWKRGAPPSTATNEWVAQLSRDPAQHWLYDRMAAVGLVTPRKDSNPKQKPKTHETRLGAFLKGYFDRRTDVKATTKVAWDYPRRDLIEFFGADKPIGKVTVGDAKDFERFMLAKLGSADTARRRLSMAKQFFADAVDREMITKNPFAKLKTACRGNRSKDFFVTMDMAYMILDACPDAEWRLIFALCRFGGLRCPSEVMALRLDAVDWDNEQILIRSPKTEHHPGKESRVIPLFPELRPYLEEVWENAEPGTEYFVKNRKWSKTNADHLVRIIERAGLKPWPKLFMNLRATRETELAEEFPAHVVVQWIGNSEAIARKHYLQVTDDHFAKAVKSGARMRCTKSDQERSRAGSGDSEKTSSPQETPVLAGLSGIPLGESMTYHDNGAWKLRA